MVKWIASVLLYLITIIAGIYIDKASYKKTHSTARKLYVLWLFIFLCFGYMVGADWPFYERDYYDFDLIQLRYFREPGSWLVFRTMPLIIHDFWVFIALFKCLYLWSAIKLLSKLSERWLTATALAIPIVLAQLLIQNPFRFMMAQFFINIAVIVLYNSFTVSHVSAASLLKIFILIVIASLFHNASVLYLFIFPFLLFCPRIGKTPSWLLLLIYITVALIASNVSIITNLISGALEQFTSMEMKDYTDSYNPEDNAAFFTLGSMAQILFFIIVLIVRRTVINKSRNGNLIFAFTICYFIISRLVIIVPTGHRFIWPLSFFYAIYIIEVLRNKKARQYGLIIVLYIMLAFTKKLWFSYDLIPYTNSIPYIVAGHKPYSERYRYNPEQCQARTGSYPEIVELDL